MEQDFSLRNNKKIQEGAKEKEAADAAKSSHEPDDVNYIPMWKKRLNGQVFEDTHLHYLAKGPKMK